MAGTSPLTHLSVWQNDASHFPSQRAPSQPQSAALLVIFAGSVFTLPALFLLLCVGLGLLVRAAAPSLPGLLVLPIGFSFMVILGQFGVRYAPSVTVGVIVLAAVVGLVLGRRALRPSSTLLDCSSVVGATYVVLVAPVLLSGRATMPNFLRDSTTGTHIAGARALLAHGVNMTSEPNTSNGLYLKNYFGNAYPSGGHVPLGVLEALLPMNAIWLWAPYLAIVLALVAPSSAFILKALGLPRALALLGGVVAAVPALVVGYDWQGSVKEISALPALVLMPALLMAGARTTRPFRLADVIGLAVAGGASVACIGVPAVAWIIVAGSIACLSTVVRERSRHPLRVGVKVGAMLAGATAVTGLPTLVNAAASFRTANSFSASNPTAANDPGNLLQPIHAVQGLGIWLSEDHRVDPSEYSNLTYGLIGVALLLAIVGTVCGVRNRSWTWLAWLGGTSAVWWLLTVKGTTWTDAKLIVLMSPTLLILVFYAIAMLFAPRLRLERFLAAVVVTVGVLGSVALQYHATNLLPTDRYAELIAIDEAFAGEGPAYLPDFDEYAFAAMPHINVVGPGFGYRPDWAAFLRGGSSLPYGSSVDLGRADLLTLEHTPIIIARNGPAQSRPPSSFARVWTGRFYTVWRNSGPRPAYILPVSGTGVVASAAGRPSCTAIAALAGRARRDHLVLRVALRPRSISLALNARSAQPSPLWTTKGGGLLLAGQGRARIRIRVPTSGVWRLWLQGDVGRTLEARVDGLSVGSVGYQSGGSGQYLTPLAADLEPGAHLLELTRGGGSLAPGDGNITGLHSLVLEPPGGSASTVRNVAASRWRSICRETVDWVELVPRPKRAG